MEQADAPRPPALVHERGGRRARGHDHLVREDPARRSRRRPLGRADPRGRPRRIPARDHGARDRPPRVLPRGHDRRGARHGAHPPRSAGQAAPRAHGGQPLRGPPHQRPPPALGRARSRRCVADARALRRRQPALDAVHEHLRAPVVAAARRALPRGGRRAHPLRRRARRPPRARVRERLGARGGALRGARAAVPRGPRARRRARRQPGHARRQDGHHPRRARHHRRRRGRRRPPRVRSGALRRGRAARSPHARGREEGPGRARSRRVRGAPEVARRGGQRGRHRSSLLPRAGAPAPRPLPDPALACRRRAAPRGPRPMGRGLAPRAHRLGRERRAQPARHPGGDDARAGLRRLSRGGSRAARRWTSTSASTARARCRRPAS